MGSEMCIRDSIPLGKVTVGVWPFLVAETIVLALLVIFPDIVLVPLQYLR